MKSPVLTRRRAAAAVDPVQPTAAGEPAVANGPGPIAPAPTLQAPKRRRRPALIAAGLILVVLGALGAYYLTQQTAQRTAVIGIARAVTWGQQLTAADLVQVQIVADPNLRPIPWSQADAVIGAQASTNLRPGTLLTRDDIVSAPIPAAGYALVGVEVGVGSFPATEVPPGSRVLLVPTGGNSGQAVATAIKQTEAQVYTIGPIESGGGRVVDVIVPVAAAPSIAAEAVAGRVAIVLLPQG